MISTEKAWQSLIDIVFNNKQDVPIEYISEFIRLAKRHYIWEYCNYLRNKELPESIKNNPTEWEFLNNLTDVLPEEVQILVLKGASARVLNLYQFPGLRKSSDLDIYIYKIKDYNKQKIFLDGLVKKLSIRLTENWQIELKKLSSISAKYKNQSVDIHFKLFSPLGNFSTVGPIRSKQNEVIEEKIMQHSLPFKNYGNIKMMSLEDFWLYNMFHFIKEFPSSSLRLIVDLQRILLTNQVSLKDIEKRATETHQLFLYKIGLHILGQLYKSLNQEVEINRFNKFIFNTDRLSSGSSYSIKYRLIDSYSKGTIVTNGNCILSIIYGSFYFLLSNSILSTIENSSSNLRLLYNFYIKCLYLFSKLKNKLKQLFLRIATSDIYKTDLEIEKTKKKLLTLQIQDLKLTFNVPEEFCTDLEKIWGGFLTANHLKEIILVEKVKNDFEIRQFEVVYSNKLVYIKGNNYIYGKASLNSSGTLFTKDFWNVRTFAMCIFRAMTFERKDLLLVHAGAVKIKDEALIFPAGSSAGKTTLFNLLLRNGASGINDDTVLLKYENAGWFVYPTPFMSRNKEPLICEKSKLSGIIDPIKVCGGHEIRTIDKNSGNAIVLNNSLSGFLIDDNDFLLSKTANKVINLSKQVLFYGQIKYSLDDELTLVKLINKWLENPNEVYSTSSHLIRLIELQGKSMEPTFKEGDILCVEEIFPEKLKPRDVICFSKDPNNFPVVHRVKYLIRHKGSTTIITKGDGSIYEDPPGAFKANQKILKITNKFNLKSMKV